MATFTHDEIDYDLSIFDKKNHIFSVDESIQISAEIHFSVHCYTENWVSGGVIQDHNKNNREFCPIRYTYSKDCLGQIDEWLKRTCIISKDNKGYNHWILIENANGQKGKVAFDIKKHKYNANSVWIRVKTIHPYDKSNPPNLKTSPQTTFKKLTKAVGIFGNIPELKVPKTLTFLPKTP
jgi:hypothetical protein